MNRYKSAFAVFIIGLISLFHLSIFAQMKSSESSSIEDKALQNYLKNSSLSPAERKKFFNEISAKERSDLWKVHFALFLVRHPDLRKDQGDLFLDVISTLTPEMYEVAANNSKTDAQKAAQIQPLISRSSALFSKQEIIELFFDSSGKAADINVVQKYINISDLSRYKAKTYFVENTTAEEKSSLWRFHLGSALVNRTQLNKNQKDLILDFITFLSAEKYQGTGISSDQTPKTEKFVEEFIKKVAAGFSAEEIREIFYNLGIAAPKSTDKDSAERPPAPLPCMCNQNVLSICNVFNYSCLGTNCIWLPLGCGPGAIFSCNGQDCY